MNAGTEKWNDELFFCLALILQNFDTTMKSEILTLKQSISQKHFLRFPFLVSDRQLWIIHGTLLQSKLDYEKENKTDECFRKSGSTRAENVEYKLKDKSEKYLVSNSKCIEGNETVLDLTTEIFEVYIEKAIIEVYAATGLKTETTFLALKQDNVTVASNSVSIDDATIWIKEKSNKEGYFMLKDPQSGKFLHQGYPLYTIQGNVVNSCNFMY